MVSLVFLWDLHVRENASEIGNLAGLQLKLELISDKGNKLQCITCLIVWQRPVISARKVLYNRKKHDNMNMLRKKEALL